MNVIEGLIDDVVNGHPPNIVKERGMHVQMREDRPAQRRMLFAVGAVATLAVLAVAWNRKR